MSNFIQCHTDEIAFSLSCYDRVVITGTLVDIGYARGATGWLGSHGIRVFDFPKWAEQLRDALRENAEAVARDNGLEIDFIQKKNFRKEKRIKAIIAERGDHSGLVHIFSAMEPCPAYKPWHDKKSHRTFLKNTPGKCLHYYFYFILPDLGLCCLRVPTWAPFRLQFYFNGHNELARKLFGVILRGEFVISGFKNADLRKHLPAKNTGQVSAVIRRLRKHGIIKKARHCYKYYLTTFGRFITTAALKLREMALIPMLRGQLST